MTRLRSNDPCWCGSSRKLKRCHGDHVRRAAVRPGTVGPPRTVSPDLASPPYVRGERWSATGFEIHHGADLDRLRESGRIAAEVLLVTAEHVEPGITTDQLDAIAHQAYVERGAYPSTLHYKGYSKSICTSVNEVVCHGIPDSRPLVEGDIVNVDVTAYVEGMHGDTSATIVVGQTDRATQALVDLTQEALHLGIDSVLPGRALGSIGEAIQPFAHAHGFGVVREYGGHGIGATFHGPPHVNHTIERDRGPVLVPGLVFTIEPMLTAGTNAYRTWDDGWTVVTADGLATAQFEHTVVVTEAGAEILTLTADGRSAAGIPQNRRRINAGGTATG